MSSQPKLRIFAGPNGSGKTTLYESIKSTYFSTQLFVNADQLEESFKKFKFINLADFKIDISQERFDAVCTHNGLYSVAGFSAQTWNLTIRKNIVVSVDSHSDHFNSYHFAILADLIRNELILSGSSFSFETVFSHPSKLDLISLAKQRKYKVYLYFIGTETPVMNVERVKDRVQKGGHPVDSVKVEKRYFLTMELLTAMIKAAHETYLWDNSGLEHKYLGSVKDGFIEFEQTVVPGWIDKFILSKFQS